jgi:hypothetical protein
MTDQDDPLFTTKEAAKHLKCSESYLAKERGKGTGPEFITLGRSIRYRRSALDAYTASRTHTSTSQYSKYTRQHKQGEPVRRRKKAQQKSPDLLDALSIAIQPNTSEYIK